MESSYSIEDETVWSLSHYRSFFGANKSVHNPNAVFGTITIFLEVLVGDDVERLFNGKIASIGICEPAE
jgi:hypothetical protein